MTTTSLSTPEHTYHQNCPTGESTWFKYKMAIAKAEEPPAPLHAPLIPPNKARYVREIFWNFFKTRAFDQVFRWCYSNQNESFHSTEWKRASKTDCTSDNSSIRLAVDLANSSIRLAVDLAVVNFNVGKQTGFSRIMTRVGVEPWIRANIYFQLSGAVRITSSQRKASTVAKRRRKALA